MGQQLQNEFSEVDFTEEEQDIIFATFTDQQLQVLQNFRAQSARRILELEFQGESSANELREHAYQRGRIELVGDLLTEVAAARQRLSELEDSLNNLTKD